MSLDSTSSFQPARPPQRFRSANEALECRDLRRFHYFMLLVGGWILVVAIAGWMSHEGVAKELAAKQAPQATRALRAALAAEFSEQLLTKVAVNFGAAIAMLSCAFGVFHFPVTATLAGFGIHLGCTVILAARIIPIEGPWSIPGLAVRIAILVGLMLAVRTAIRFQLS